MTGHWKFLRAGAVSPFTGFDWRSTAGAWVTAGGARPCEAGIHACRLSDLPYWLSEELWEIELAEPVVPAETKVAAARARLLGRVEVWTEATARVLSEACSARVAQHAAAELHAAGRPDDAVRLAGAPFSELPPAARRVLEAIGPGKARQAVALCGAVVDAAEAVEAYPVGIVAYMAARAANQRSGPADADYYAAERSWQAEQLAGLLRTGAAARHSG